MREKLVTNLRGISRDHPVDNCVSKKSPIEIIRLNGDRLNNFHSDFHEVNIMNIAISLSRNFNR